MRHRFTLSVAGWLAAAAVAIAGGRDPRPPGSSPPPKPSPCTVDVILCLDCSNSMDHLIQSAKVKLWDIVNDLARLRPAPSLRVGLYSYGNDRYDSSNGWVRKEVDLCTDLDEIYRRLNALSTQGGTEYATRVCRDALVQQQWSSGPQAMRLVFVCGNEPADQDRQTPMGEIAGAAKRMGVVIHPIYCGGARDGDARSWRHFAAACGGTFTNIDAARSIYVPTTPYDPRLGELSIRLQGTYVAYGVEHFRRDKAENQVAQDANAKQLGGGVAASRAVAKASRFYDNSGWDLVDRMEKDKSFELRTLSEEQLPDWLRKLPADQRDGAVRAKQAERESIQREINELAAKRQRHLDEQQRQTAAGGRADAGLDVALRQAIREEATRKGMTLPE